MIDWRTEYERAIAERNELIQRVQVLEGELSSLVVAVETLSSEIETTRHLLRNVPVPDYRSEYAQWQDAVDDYLETL